MAGHSEEASAEIPLAPGFADTASGLLPISKSGISVLVVDDDRSLREGCVSFFQMEGYDVTSEGNRAAALDLVRRRRFDLVILSE